MNEAKNNPKEVALQPYLSPLAVWALSVGSAIGWGSLVVTSSSYLSQAGPMGSILGLLIGFLECKTKPMTEISRKHYKRKSAPSRPLYEVCS